MATLEIDPDFNIHTSYHNDFFLLRTRVLVNGENTEIRSVKEGKYEGPVLNFCNFGNAISTTLLLISTTVSPILVQYGVYHVDTFYYEQSPLFHVVFTSESCLKNFILAIGEVKSALEPQLQFLFSHNLKTESVQQLTVEVQPELFLVSPNHHLTKGAEVHLVTAEKCPTFVARWKGSKLFDFGALYSEEAKLPNITSQPLSLKDAPPGKAVVFSVEATGTLPLKYQWQWKQFGKAGEQDGWKNLSCEGNTFQLMDVQEACNAGYYRCVVSNSAGSSTSHCARLTVVPQGPEVRDLANELHKVIDWIPFGLNLGLKMEELKTIEANYPTLQRRRIEMLEEWQKKVTPTWSAVVQALMGIGMRRLASELAQKNGVSLTQPRDDETLEHLANTSLQEEVTGSKLLSEVQKRTEPLKQECRKVADVEKRLKHSQELKSAVNDNFSQLMSRLEELHKKAQKLVQEKKILTIELQSKERECQLLSEMKEKDAAHSKRNEAHIAMIEEKINKKRKKIEQLEKELQRKESDLQSALQEAKIWQEKLSQTQVELKKKHEEVKELQEEKEKLSCSFNIKQKQFSKLVQLTVTLTSEKTEMEQQLVSMKEESESRLRHIESCNLSISCLSEEVKQKETTLVQLKSELQSYEQVYGTPEQLLELLELEPQVAELQRRLQEAEDQKQLLELERDTAFEEVEVMRNFVTLLHMQLDEPPKITSHPKSLKEISPGKPVAFTVEATGTEPLNYHWEWKPAAEDGSEEWQPCRTEWSDGATLTIPSVQKFNAGSYRCVISSCVGTTISKPAQLSVVYSSPAITSEEHARRLRMTQAGDEEEVVVSDKSHKKKRKKKIKKGSSRYSNASNSLERLTDVAQDYPDTDMPTLHSLNLRDNDTVPEEHSSEMTVYDTCTQAISEHAVSEEADTAITANTEGTKTREVTHRGQRERSAEESSHTPNGYDDNVIQATDQEGYFMADTSVEIDSVQLMTEDGRVLAEDKEKEGQLSSEEDLVMFEDPSGDFPSDPSDPEDPSLLETVMDTALHSHMAMPNIDQGILKLSDDPLDLNKTCTEAKLSLSGSKSDPEAHASKARMTFGASSLLENAVDTATREPSVKGRLAAFPHQRDSTSSTESLEDVSQQETVAGADIWMPIPHPSRTHLRSVCLSEELLWIVDIRGMVFCTTTESKGRDWQMIQRSMEQITSSSSGKIVWGLHHQKAYVRLGIGKNPAGSSWKKLTKWTTIAPKIKHIAADENGVWAIKIDGQVLFRKGVTEANPEGRIWKEVGHPAVFTHVACCNETIWVITSSGKVFIRDGVTPAAPSGKKWIEVKAPKLTMVALTSNGVVWGVDQESQMGFRRGITRKRAQGKGPWWEVSISALSHPSSPYNSLWQVMSTELGGSQLLASLPPSVSSLVTSHPVHHKLVAISASAKVGVVVLEAGSRLHACWSSVTGYHYTSACKDDGFQLTAWIKLAVGSTALWLVHDDGELYCLTREDKLIHVKCSGYISLMAASPSVLWAVFIDIVWSRKGMTPEVPEGISWDYIELSTLLQERKLRHIACGNRAVWAIDSTGVPHFRFGVHAHEPGTEMSPAWVPVDDNPEPLYRITISPDDWSVWACGESYNVYVRTAVIQDLPVGTAWELVQGVCAKELCASSGKVYALTPGGDLLCRFGITESNLQGNYWRRMPGKYAHISTSPSGDLWTLDEKGQVWKQECKAIAVSQDPGASRSELEMSMVVPHLGDGVVHSCGEQV